ncbi:MAG: glycosyltransferase family 4 protein [Chloroflexota bacterium]|nr:MAG: glycosyltransferase family 4 protein [Chloroflexota bacterium]
MAKRRLRVGFTLQNQRMQLAGNHSAALQLRHILQGLTSAGHRPTLLALRDNRRVLCTSDPVVVRYGQLGFSDTPGFKLVESSIRRGQRELRVPYMGFFDSYRFYEACAKNLSGCQLLHERNSLFSIGTALASRRLGLPYVLSLDADELFELDHVGKPLRGFQRRVAQWASRLTYRVADALTCVSPAAKRHFVSQWSIPEHKITVLPNGVDVHFFLRQESDDPVRSSLGLKNRPIVMFVGGFFRWHGLELLIDSFQLVSQEAPTAHLVLVGDGDTRAAIQLRVGTLGLNRSVTFTGPVEHEDVPAYLSAADVCVAPYPRFSTEFWGSPMKLYEYMAAGKAIVASNAGIIGEVIQNRVTGLLTDPGDKFGLANAIVSVLDDPELRFRLGQNARQRVVEMHSWDNYVRQLEKIYARVL